MADYLFPGAVAVPGSGTYPGVYSFVPEAQPGPFDVTTPALRTFTSAPTLATYDDPEPFQ